MKDRKRRTFIIIIVLLIIIAIAAAYYFFVRTGKIDEIINNEVKKNRTMDNYNGVYENKEEVSEAYSIFAGCTIKSISKYIVVINKKYETYRSTCMGTYKIDEGNTKDLNFLYDQSEEKYKVTYKNEEYSKNISVHQIIPNNDIKEKLTKINLDSYKFILKETEFINNYYEIDAEIIGASELHFNVTSNRNGFQLSIYTTDKSVPIYNYYSSSVDNLPEFSIYYNKLIILEPTYISNKPHYKLKLLSTRGIEYDLDNQFPITINNINLNTTNGIVVKKDKSEKYYNVLISKKESFCYEDETSNNEIAYYVFKIDFDTYNATLNKPLFVSNIYKNESCTYYNKIMEE